jgi:hypothetical protein
MTPMQQNSTLRGTTRACRIATSVPPLITFRQPNVINQNNAMGRMNPSNEDPSNVNVAQLLYLFRPLSQIPVENRSF